MAAALEVVTVAQAKDELRIPQDNTELDAQIERQIEAAVAFCGDKTGRPFLDTKEQFTRCVTYGESDPVFGPGDVLSLTKVSYYLPDDSLWEAPTGVLDGVYYRSITRNTMFYPPGGKWPDRSYDQFVFEVVRGVPAAEIPKAISAAAIIMLRMFFDGTNDDTARIAAQNILAPHVLT